MNVFRVPVYGHAGLAINEISPRRGYVSALEVETRQAFEFLLKASSVSVLKHFYDKRAGPERRIWHPRSGSIEGP